MLTPDRFGGSDCCLIYGLAARLRRRFHLVFGVALPYPFQDALRCCAVTFISSFCHNTIPLYLYMRSAGVFSLLFTCIAFLACRTFAGSLLTFGCTACFYAPLRDPLRCCGDGLCRFLFWFYGLDTTRWCSLPATLFLRTVVHRCGLRTFTFTCLLPLRWICLCPAAANVTFPLVVAGCARLLFYTFLRTV